MCQKYFSWLKTVMLLVNENKCIQPINIHYLFSLLLQASFLAQAQYGFGASIGLNGWPFAKSMWCIIGACLIFLISGIIPKIHKIQYYLINAIFQYLQPLCCKQAISDWEFVSIQKLNFAYFSEKCRKLK